MPDLPSSLALTTIATSSQILSADHRNNYTSIQTMANAILTALSGGAAGQLLTATDSDTIAYQTVARVQVRMSSAQNNTTSGSFQTMNWDAEDTDPSGFHDNVTNNDRLTVPTGLGGVYLVMAQAAFASTTATIGVKITKNGSDAYALLGPGVASNGTGIAVAPQLVTLAAGDIIRAQGFQGSGGTLAYQVGASGSSPFLSMYRIATT